MSLYISFVSAMSFLILICGIGLTLPNCSREDTIKGGAAIIILSICLLVVSLVTAMGD